MKKYRLYRFQYEIFKDWWVLPFAVVIMGQDPVYREKNFQISAHFLCFHAKWVFMEEINK